MKCRKSNLRQKCKHFILSANFFIISIDIIL
nr:MAG TPA: hypothetical protein [Caudoviricetes sp.]